MKFNSQICTSREQSEHLLALGLKKETADMHWEDEAYFDDYEDWNAYVGSPKHSEHIPAWSLHRLLEIIIESPQEYYMTWVPNAYDDIISVIESQIKEGYFNKYLEEKK